MGTIVFVLGLMAQGLGGAGTVQGTVKDPTGALVVKAQVEVASSALIGTKKAETDQGGYYRFANLPPGMYSLTVTAPGFRTFKQERIPLEVGHLPSIEVRLDMGAVSETVEVSSQAAVIERTSAWLVRSAATKTVLQPAFANSSATASPRSRLRPVTISPARPPILRPVDRAYGVAFRNRAIVFSHQSADVFTAADVACGAGSPDGSSIASYKADPLITLPISVSVLLGLYSTSERVVADAQAIQVPTQLLISDSDWVVHRKPQLQFFDRLGSSVKEKHVFHGFHHDILGEKDRHLAMESVREFILSAFARSRRRAPLLDAHKGGEGQRNDRRGRRDQRHNAGIDTAGGEESEKIGHEIAEECADEVEPDGPRPEDR